MNVFFAIMDKNFQQQDKEYTEKYENTGLPTPAKDSPLKDIDGLSPRSGDSNSPNQSGQENLAFLSTHNLVVISCSGFVHSMVTS